MKKINAKYLAVAAATSGTMLATMGGAVFADTVPVYLTAGATAIDVTIGTGLTPDGQGKITIDPGTPSDNTDDYQVSTSPNAIYMTAPSDTNTAHVTNVIVKNNKTNSPVYITNIKLDNITSGYTNSAFTDDYTAKPVDSKNFGVAITKVGSTTLGTAADLRSTGYSPATADTVAADGTLTYELAGKVSASSAAISNVKIADCVVTLAQTTN